MIPRLILFDCDGTLVDSQAGIVTSMQTAFLSFGLIAPPPDAVKRVVGLSLDVAVRRLAPEMGQSDALQVAGLYKETFRNLRLGGALQEPMYEGIKAAVLNLDQPCTVLGVATGKSRRGLDAVLERHGLSARFQTLQTADDVAAGKPAPDMCLKACAEMGIDPTETLVIGDTTFDMEMARSAGAQAIGVAWGYHATDELSDAGARAIVATAAEIGAAVERLLPRGEGA
ncbi:MAG: HAD-IA family hydrolase [Minwuia sp.]|nr:HAD-IA family hydrolase [Minwuia sp.]